MGRNHIKRLRAPKSWEILRKDNKWIAKPRPGTHTISQSLTISTILKEYLKIAKTTKEVKFILHNNKVKIDGQIRKDHKFGVGLMDVISIDDINLYFRVLYNKKGKLFLHPIQKEESNFKPVSIIGKTILKKKKTQINLQDGRNLLSENKEYRVNDTLNVDLSSGKIVDHIKLEKGSLIYLIEGKKVGTIGHIKEIEKKKGLQHPKIIFTSEKEEFETLNEYALVIGKNKPIISIPE